MRLEVRRSAGAGQGKLLLRRSVVYRQALLREVEAERRERVQLVELRAIDGARGGEPQEQIVAQEKAQIEARQNVRVVVLWTDRVVVHRRGFEEQRRPQRVTSLGRVRHVVDWVAGVSCTNRHLFVDGGIRIAGDRHRQIPHLKSRPARVVFSPHDA